MNTLSDLKHWQPGEQLWTSGQPQAKHWPAIAQLGAQTLIDLRGPSEGAPDDEQATVEAAGLRYLALPTPDASAVTFEQAAALAKLLDENEGGIWVHCASGNRAGALLALKAASEGKSIDEALAIGRNAGMTSLESKVRSLLEAR